MEAALVSLDANGAIVATNQQAEQIFGRRFDQIKGEKYASLFDRSEKLSNNIKRCLKDKTSIGYDYYDYQTTEGIKTLGVSITFVEPSGEQIKGCSLLISDQTELKRLEKELATSERLSALGEMASGLAHQLRNSMGAMIGFGTLIRKKQEKQETDPKSLANLLAEVKEAESLIGRFLDFARPLRPIYEPVRLSTYLSEVVNSCRSRIENDRIQVELVIADDAEIMIDPLLIKQALSNIIDNAVIAYGTGAGKVQVVYRSEGQLGVVVVTDQGSGIAADIRANIFTPFYSTRPAGSGLGLPLAARIIESHNGRIELQSEPGRGTTFSLYLPLEAAAVSSGGRVSTC
jgi:two-component system sensor histidine kinase AtoS